MNIPFDYEVQVFKALQAEQGAYIVEGYASIADLPDMQDDVITQEAIESSAKDLEGKTLLWNHDPERPIGHILSSEARPQGLYIKAEVSKTEPDIWQKVEDGTISKFSIRGKILDASSRYVEEIGQTVQFIRRMQLIEASLVSLPAQPRAAVVRFYVEKALTEFVKSGGVIPVERGGERSMTKDKALDVLSAALEKSDNADVKAALAALKAMPMTDTDHDKERKEHEDTKKSMTDSMAKKEQEIETLKKSGEQAIQSLQEQLTKSQETVKALQDTIDEQKAESDTAEMWSTLVGKSFKEEDAEVIRPILKKNILKQALTKEEMETLLKKGIGRSGLKVSTDGGVDTSGAMTLEQERAAVARFKIRPKTGSALAQKA